MTTPVVTRPLGTSWGAVLGGWIASVGMAALLAPIMAGVFANRTYDPNDLAIAVPPIAALMVAYLVGGYVAGRMAGYSTSWHGMLTAFFGLFVVLAAILVGYAADRGLLGDMRVSGTSLGTFRGLVVGDALTFGAILGFLATIFSGWLGGLLAPDRYAAGVVAAPATADTAVVRTVEEQKVVRERPRFRLLPAIGRKGGERHERVERESRVEDRDVP